MVRASCSRTFVDLVERLGFFVVTGSEADFLHSFRTVRATTGADSLVPVCPSCGQRIEDHALHERGAAVFNDNDLRRTVSTLPQLAWTRVIACGIIASLTNALQDRHERVIAAGRASGDACDELLRFSLTVARPMLDALQRRHARLVANSFVPYIPWHLVLPGAFADHHFPHVQSLNGNDLYETVVLGQRLVAKRYRGIAALMRAKRWLQIYIPAVARFVEVAVGVALDSDALDVDDTCLGFIVLYQHHRGPTIEAWTNQHGESNPWDVVMVLVKAATTLLAYHEQPGGVHGNVAEQCRMTSWSLNAEPVLYLPECSARLAVSRTTADAAGGADDSGDDEDTSNADNIHGNSPAVDVHDFGRLMASVSRTFPDGVFLFDRSRNARDVDFRACLLGIAEKCQAAALRGRGRTPLVVARAQLLLLSRSPSSFSQFDAAMDDTCNETADFPSGAATTDEPLTSTRATASPFASPS